MGKIRENLWSVVVAGIFLGVLVAYLFTFQVPAATWGVVYWFGEYKRTHEEPGLKFRWPTPIEEVELLDQRVRLFDTRLQENLTRDKNNLLVKITTGWKITDPRKFINRLRTEVEAEKNIRSRVENVYNKTLGEYYFYELVNTDYAQQQETFREFEQKMRMRLNEELQQADYGVAVDVLAVQQMTFPASVSEKVFNRMIRERETESKAYRAEGESEYRSTVSEAETEANKILAKARAEAQIKRGQGDAEAAEHYKVFKENPELANLLREIQSLRQILAEQRTTLVLSTEDLPFHLLREKEPLGESGTGSAAGTE